MGAKIKTPKNSLALRTNPKKIPGPKFNPQRVPCRISEPQKFPEELHSRDTRGSYWELLRIFKSLSILKKYPYLNQATRKKTCQNFCAQKHPAIIPVT